MDLTPVQQAEVMSALITKFASSKSIKLVMPWYVYPAEVPEGQERVCLRLLSLDSPAEVVRVYWNEQRFSFMQELFADLDETETLWEKSVEELTEWLVARSFLFDGRKNFTKRFQRVAMKHNDRLLEAILAARLLSPWYNNRRSMAKATSALAVQVLIGQGYHPDNGTDMEACVLSVAKNVDVAQAFVAAGANMRLLLEANVISASTSVIMYYLKECPGELPLSSWFLFSSLTV